MKRKNNAEQDGPSSIKRRKVMDCSVEKSLLLYINVYSIKRDAQLIDGLKSLDCIKQKKSFDEEEEEIKSSDSKKEKKKSSGSKNDTKKEKKQSSDSKKEKKKSSDSKKDKKRSSESKKDKKKSSDSTKEKKKSSDSKKDKKKSSEKKKSKPTKVPLKDYEDEDDKIMIRSLKHKNDIESLKEKYGNDIVVIEIDIRSDLPWNVFSFKYPCGGFKIPGTTRKYSMSIQGMYEGYKLDENNMIDLKYQTLMRGVPVRKLENSPGWKFGTEVIDEEHARWHFIIKPFQHYLERKKLPKEGLKILRGYYNDENINKIILLSSSQNTTIEDYGKQISEAWLLKMFIMNEYPEMD